MIEFKASTLQDDYAFVYANDAAIDHDVEGWEKSYQQAIEHNDLSKLPLRPGMEPTVFWMRHPRGKLRRHLLDRLKVDKANLAMREIAELSLNRLDGSETDIDTVLGPSGFHIVAPTIMDEIDDVDEGALVNDMANHVINRLFLSPK